MNSLQKYGKYSCKSNFRAYERPPLWPSFELEGPPSFTQRPPPTTLNSSKQQTHQTHLKLISGSVSYDLQSEVCILSVPETEGGWGGEYVQKAARRKAEDSKPPRKGSARRSGKGTMQTEPRRSSRPP